MKSSTQHTDIRMSSAKNSAGSKESLWQLLGRTTLFFIHLAIAGVVLIVGVLLIQTRAAATEPVQSASRVTVQTTTIERSASYQIERRFVGLIESYQTTDLAFETGGTVSDIFVQEGDLVDAGRVLAAQDQSSLKAQRDQILAARQASKLTLQRADLALQRERDLSAKGYGSEEALDNARLSTEDASAALINVEAQVREISVRLSKSVLKAPFKAKVGERLVDTGGVAASGQPVLRLYEQRYPTARIGIPADLHAQWELRETARILVNGEEYVGRFAGQRPDVSAGTRVIETRFDLIDDGKDWPAVGQMAQLYWEDTQRVSGYWVPVGALSEGKRGLWSVLRLAIEEGSQDSDSKTAIATVVREHVEVVHTDGDRAYIEAAMPDSVQIVFSGSHRVVPEQRVQIANFSK